MDVAVDPMFPMGMTVHRSYSDRDVTFP